MSETEEKKNSRRVVWYALQTFYQKEQQVADYLKEQGMSPFIPMLYREQVLPDGKKHRELAPAVHNLLFLRKESSEKALRQLLAGCLYPVRILCYPQTDRYYEIPDVQMTEFRAICDPGYTGTIYSTREFAEARPGQPVRVLTGKLVRYKNRSFVVITLATLGVFVHIPKWYCEKIETL